MSPEYRKALSVESQNIYQKRCAMSKGEISITAWRRHENETKGGEVSWKRRGMKGGNSIAPKENRAYRAPGISEYENSATYHMK